jgi:hypothetical protein
MNKIIIILCLLINFKTNAQEIIYRQDSNQVITLLTSTEPLQLEPLFCSVNAVVLLPKDTVTTNVYLLSFFYNTPKEITLDTTAEVEIRFSDGTLFSYNYNKNADEVIPKDSSACFGVMVSYNCLRKMTKVPVSEITFVTPLYSHRIDVEDMMKLYLPNLAKYLLDKAAEEYLSILETERFKNVPNTLFDTKANIKLDKKYYGKYTGESCSGEFIYKFDLFIQSDTSYALWYVIKDPYEKDPKRIKKTLLNIHTLTDNNTLIMDICYDSSISEYTNGKRSLYLKLSEDGNVIYGKTIELDKFFGEMYGIRKKGYLK